MKLLLNLRPLSILIILSIICISNTFHAQELHLIIGKYDCTNNGDCAHNQFCDIDTHRCINYADRAECPTTSDPTTCPDLSDYIKPEDCPTTACPDYSDYIKPEECPIDTITCSLGQINLNNNCVECVNNDNCAGEKPFCHNNQCIACTSTTHWNNYECITCSGDKPKWDETSLTCVECLTNNDCPEACDKYTKTCHPCVNIDIEKPYYNAKTKKCEECPSKIPFYDTEAGVCRSCIDADATRPQWNVADRICEACPEFYKWDTAKTKCVRDYECRTNEDCIEYATNNNLSNANSYYCYTNSSESMYQEFGSKNKSGKCRNAKEDYNVTDVYSNGAFYKRIRKSKLVLNYWSAERFCKALGNTMLTLEDLKCADAIKYAGGFSAMYCHAYQTGNPALFQENNISPVIVGLYNAFGDTIGWVTSAYTATPYDFNYKSGYINANQLNDSSFALCY